VNRISAILLAGLAAWGLAGSAPPARAGWVPLPNAPIAPTAYERHDDVFFVTPDSGWVVNGAGQIHRTTDGGQSWILQTTVPNYLRSVGFATQPSCGRSHPLPSRGTDFIRPPHE